MTQPGFITPEQAAELLGSATASGMSIAVAVAFVAFLLDPYTDEEGADE